MFLSCRVASYGRLTDSGEERDNRSRYLGEKHARDYTDTPVAAAMQRNVIDDPRPGKVYRGSSVVCRLHGGITIQPRKP